MKSLKYNRSRSETTRLKPSNKRSNNEFRLKKNRRHFNEE